jgi:DNA adenine methylase
MKPIIKWSGGKSQEIKNFKEFYPKNYNFFIEPFLGGGAVYFDLENKQNIINDISFELISLYEIIKKDNNKVFFEILNQLNNQRNEFNDFVLNMDNKQIEELFINNDFDISILKNIILINNDILNSEIIKSVKDKIKRIKKIEKENNKTFNIEEKKEHLTTSLQSALYFYSRKIYNNGNKENIEFYIANWFYVREFCYSSMFRFSKNGNFNVPYGGIGYNTKDFKIKIDNLKNINLINLLKNTDINCLDFEKLFNKYNYFSPDDFMFLDPPYDSEFSQYNKENDFDKNEQIRLYNNVKLLNCKWMMVIKETEFIYNLYKEFNIIKFDKKYLTNMRNRNDKDVVHLIITNYEV